MVCSLQGSLAADFLLHKCDLGPAVINTSDGACSAVTSPWALHVCAWCGETINPDPCSYRTGPQFTLCLSVCLSLPLLFCDERLAINPGLPRTYYVAQIGLEPVSVLHPQLPKC